MTTPERGPSRCPASVLVVERQPAAPRDRHLEIGHAVPHQHADPSGHTERNWFIATTGGTAATIEPAWPQNPGQKVTDGGVIWTCVGPFPNLQMVTRPDADLWQPGLALNGYGTVWHAALVEYTGISSFRWQ